MSDWYPGDYEGDDMNSRQTIRVSTLLGCVVPCCLAQTSTGTILGTVKDNTDAAIAGARVVVTNTATAARLEVQTSVDGSYTAPLLPPGGYTVKVTAQGFKVFEQTGIQLQIQPCSSSSSPPSASVCSFKPKLSMRLTGFASATRTRP